MPISKNQEKVNSGYYKSEGKRGVCCIGESMIEAKSSIMEKKLI